MIPNKLQRGQQFKPSVVDKINQIIDYLKTQRIIGDNKTIKVNQLTNSIALTALSNGTRKGGGSSQIDHPFKLKIKTQEDGTQVLTIQQGRIWIDGDGGERCYYVYDENEDGSPTYLPLPKEDGSYHVNGYICYDQSNTTESNVSWSYGCVYAKVGITTAEFTNSCGFTNFVIGNIKVETDKEDQSKKIYTIEDQYVFSSPDIYDGGIGHDFKARWQMTSYPQDGAVVESLIANKLIINGGYFYADGIEYYIEDFEQTVNNLDDSIYCIEYIIDTSVTIKKVNIDEYLYYDEQKATYLIPICYVYNGYSAGIIQQFIENSIIFNIKGKVLLNQLDKTPSQYLNSKIAYETKDRETLQDDQKKFYPEGSNKYIVGITEDLNKDDDEALPNLVDNLYWDWTAISKFDKEKTQVITNDKGTLKWAPASGGDFNLEISGSLQALLQVVMQKKSDTKQTDGEEGKESEEQIPVIRYKPQYDKDMSEDDFFYFIVQTHDRTIATWTWAAEEQGQGIMAWDYTLKQPLVHVPPQPTDEISTYVLAGRKNQPLQWLPYGGGGSGNISLSGSIQNLFELVEEVSGQTLRVSTEYDGSIDQYHFVNLDAEGKLQLTSFDGTGVDSLMLWNNEEEIGPVIYDCPEAEEDTIYFLTGDKENGVLWQNLYDYCETVKVTEEDSVGDYLFNKVESSDESIMVTVDDTDTYQMLDITINPDWFISSDESVIIEYTEDGFLDFTGAGMVQVTEEDYPDFLINKLGSSWEHITIDVNSDQLGIFADLNLNPETFISSDESIIIEATEDGYIDFTGAGMVQVTESDYPDFLISKIASSKEHLTVEHNSDEVGQFVDLNINPAAFTSSDYSVMIEQTEDGLIDITEAGKVQVNSDDLPDYLDQKLVSEDQSLIIQQGQGNGQSMTMNLQINPEYFTSSDESIIITADTENSCLDFTGAGKVQVSEEDIPGFLQEKIEIDPALASFLTLEPNGDSSKLLLKPAIKGTGLVAVQNGEIQIIEAPTSGSFVLTANNGVFSWEAVSDCENACSTEDGEGEA